MHLKSSSYKVGKETRFTRETFSVQLEHLSLSSNKKMNAFEIKLI